MVGLHSSEILTFFLLTSLVLAAARVFGEVALKFRQPVLIGEILAGILLGPSVFGFFFPDFSRWLIPQDGHATIYLEGLSTLSVTLLLLLAGMEVEFSDLCRQGPGIILTSFMGFVLPFLVGVAGVYLLLPAPGLGTDSGGMISIGLFAVFFGTTLAISALPVIARILLDLGLLKTRVGTVIMSAAMLDDLVGWIILPILLSLSTAKIVLAGNIVQVAGLTLGFAVFMLTAGRWLIDRLLPWMQSRLIWPGGIIVLVLVLTLTGSAATEAIGIHAVFGAFLVGIAIGDSKHLDQASRHVIRLLVLSLFAPIYFTSVGLKLNFLDHFDLQLTLIVLVLACFGKVVGCGLGAYWNGMTRNEALAVGFGMNARGMMTIIFTTLAFQHGLIGESFLVAFVVLAITTSVISGPMLKYFINRRRPGLVSVPAAWGVSKEDA